MKILLNALAVIALSGLTAGGMVYADNHCPKKQEALQSEINEAVAKYISNHPQQILDNIAKDDGFAQVVKNVSNVSDSEIADKIRDFIENNPAIFENYIRNNAAFVASSVLSTDEMKNEVAKLSSVQSAEEVKEDISEEKESQPQEDPNKKYKDHWKELTEDGVSPTVGPKDAKVTVVEFFDFACGHCKALAPVMSQIMKNNPDVRFIYKPLFFISDQSPYAAKVSLAAAQKGKFAEVYGGIMTLPDMNEETINQILTDENLDVNEVKKMIEEKKIRRGIQDIDALSQVLDINGVPMLLINGEVFYGRSLEDIQNKINSYK